MAGPMCAMDFIGPRPKAFMGGKPLLKTHVGNRHVMLDHMYVFSMFGVICSVAVRNKCVESIHRCNPASPTRIEQIEYGYASDPNSKHLWLPSQACRLKIDSGGQLEGVSGGLG
jgi:hypothetical protein